MMFDNLANTIAGSKTARHLVHKLVNARWFQPIAELMLHRMPIGLWNLTQCGLTCDIVCDVGAYAGEWTQMALPIFPSARFVLIEAQKEKEALLLRVAQQAPGRIVHHLCLVGSEEKEAVPFYLAETGSSVYRETTSFKPFSVVDLPMRTLDRLLASEKGSIFLKLDVQGAELDVLAGAKQILKRTDAILLEASLLEYNEGAPQFTDVVGELARWGYRAFDILDVRRIGPILAQIDIVFVKEDSPLARRAQEHVRTYGSQ